MAVSKILNRITIQARTTFSKGSTKAIIHDGKHYWARDLILDFHNRFQENEVDLEILDPQQDPGDPRFASDEAQQLLTMWREFYPTIGFVPPWVGYLVVDANSREILGGCSLVHDIASQRAEISYWTFVKYQGRGVAYIACAKLCFIAQKTEPTTQLFAKTAPEHNASTKVLQRCGFSFNCVVQDHEIGDAWEWILA